MKLRDLQTLTDSKDQFVLLEFYADWSPCRSLTPCELTAVAAAHQTPLVVEHIDVTQSPGASEAFMIDTVPSVLLYRGGTLFQRWDGPCNPLIIVQDFEQVITEWAVCEACHE
ncbi:Thioredoxin-1 [Rosistilla carotiformis]|uniref:Thioredoxin-1 n=1 Tax=Rosistilla carotiformis TaxID=2528017 RepID=A0A518K1J2_9BACT|nr:thioredoxin family protein [Rosistilla carotiformis]QDV71684.1 Thioredoxin-1 [Rosistilla carotiformis]